MFDQESDTMDVDDIANGRFEGSCQGKRAGSSLDEDDVVWVVRRVYDSSEDEGSSDETCQESSKLVDSRPSTSVGCCADRQNTGGMCLHEAADTNNFYEIFKGKYCKEDVNRPNTEGERPLHYAAEIGSESVVGLLIDKGADVSAEDDDGLTPLILAANYGHAGVCEALLDAGASVNFQDDLKMTALHFAASMGQADVVRLLLDRGADPLLEDEDGLRAYHYARSARQYEVKKMLRQAETGSLANASMAG